VANVVYAFPTRTLLVRPYLIGGVGYYRLRTRVEARLAGQTERFDSGPSNEFGVNGGVGLDVPLGALTVFGEARYHRLFTDDATSTSPATTLLPLRVGIRF
jgi:hypothetical protein